MSILIDENSRVIIQGMTGKEGSTACRLMLKYGTRVECGVTPGKGGQQVEGKPIYDTIREAASSHPVNTSLIYVPPLAVKDAAFEALANGIKLVCVITEHVPMHDAASIVAAARDHDARIIGPSSLGVISPGKALLGALGGETPEKYFRAGNVGVISKSGAMTTEISNMLTLAGLGQSTSISIGGDYLQGLTFSDCLELFQNDPATEAVVIFGEHGGLYEEQAAELITKGGYTKPLVAFVAGFFAERLPQGLTLGHAGAIIEGNTGTPTHKVAALRQAGALVADRFGDIPKLVKQALQK
ncbi:CoA-binding protein [Candidatus Micrarchaeota archaeon]|nr:CoA-binding protein [Candidatus Micrarchaeota archaeon]